MPSDGTPPAASGPARLALGVAVTWPALAATYAQATVARRRFATVPAVRRALAELGLGALAARPLAVRALGTGKSNAVVAVDVDGGPRLVVKRALPFGSLLAWGARRFGANFTYAADTRGPARIAREHAALVRLAAAGVAVPAFLAAAPARELLALAWVDGAPTATALHGAGGVALAGDVGALLRRVHDLGVTLGDGHPGNMLCERGTGRLVLFDLEFAECAGATPARRGFDLAYTALLVPTPAHVDALLAGYGPRADADHAGYRQAAQHVGRFGRLLAMERARWAPTAAR
ncbi:MAG: phosphotransferase [Kofleriaceae bacterium]